MALKITLLTLSWFLVGLVVALILILKDLKGKEYDPDYFDDMLPIILILTMMGYMSLVFALVAFINWRAIKETITKFIFELANPPKKDETIEEDKGERDDRR